MVTFHRCPCTTHAVWRTPSGVGLGKGEKEGASLFLLMEQLQVSNVEGGYLGARKLSVDLLGGALRDMNVIRL